MTQKELQTLAQEHTNQAIGKERDRFIQHPSLIDEGYQAGFRKALELVREEFHKTRYSRLDEDVPQVFEEYLNTFQDLIK